MGFNNSVEGMDFSGKQLAAIWCKAAEVAGQDPDIVRKDKAGAWIVRGQYGYDGDELGMSWEVDHIMPKSQGGSDDVDNLQPLQGLNNRSKCDDCPEWTSRVSAEADQNIYKDQVWTI